MGCSVVRGRLWYPQLDIYDAARRMAGLLLFWDPASLPSQERLYIADFYLANPPLLHNTHMTSEVRKEFNSLGVPRPEKLFVSYPSAPLLFQKMEEVQKHAFRTMTGKGLIDLPSLERGLIKPSEPGATVFEEQFAPLFGDQERRLGHFIANSFTRSGERIDALRRSTGLRRVSG
jgi:ABC-3C biological conflict system middle component